MKREDALQAAVVDFLNLALPPTALFFHVPNGGGRSKSEAAKFKRLGVVAGIPDILIVYNTRVTFIELKAPSGVLSPEQKVIHSRLTQAFCAPYVCRSVDEVMAACANAGIPLRARVGA